MSPEVAAVARALKSQRAPKSLRLTMPSSITLDEVTMELSRDAGFVDLVDKGAGATALDVLLKST